MKLIPKRNCFFLVSAKPGFSVPVARVIHKVTVLGIFQQHLGGEGEVSESTVLIAECAGGTPLISIMLPVDNKALACQHRLI